MKTVRQIMVMVLLCSCMTSAQEEISVIKDVVNETAEKVELKITRLSIDDNIYTPFYRAVTARENEREANAKWLRFGVEYTTEGGWIDELIIRYAVSSPEINGETQVRMVEEVTYLNVGPGDHIGYVYLHPGYVERYDIDAYDLDLAVHFFIRRRESVPLNRDPIGTRETTKHHEEGWSEKGNVKLALGHLLNRAETPFWFINYDEHELIKTGVHWHDEVPAR